MQMQIKLCTYIYIWLCTFSYVIQITAEMISPACGECPSGLMTHWTQPVFLEDRHVRSHASIQPLVAWLVQHRCALTAHEHIHALIGLLGILVSRVADGASTVAESGIFQRPCTYLRPSLQPQQAYPVRTYVPGRVVDVPFHLEGAPVH